MPDTSRHLIVTVHGIRTFGNWQDRLEVLVKEADPSVIVSKYKYGFYSTLAFLFPPLRWLVARRFRKDLVSRIQSMPEDSRIDLVAHSFGTFLVAAALPYVPKGRRIHTLIFAASVLRPSFPWYKYQQTEPVGYLQADTVGRLVNECGWDDNVLLLCQSAALLLGMAGRVGFHGMVSERFVNRYYRFGHSGYFDAENRFMRTQWLPLLIGEGPVVPQNNRPDLTTWAAVKLFVLNNLHVIKLAVACLLLLAVVLLPIDWYRKAEYQRRAERLNHIALLANAQQIPGHDPTHIRDLLKVDAQASGDEHAIDHLIGTQGSSENLDEAQEQQNEEAQHWWEKLPGMFDSVREAYRARLEHARGNQQLAVGKGNGVRQIDKARAHFEKALSGYQRIRNYDPANGSYALCLIDYGLLLDEMGDFRTAAEQFVKVREEVFPPDGRGRRPTMPASVAVDSYIYEAESLKLRLLWDAAASRLSEAVKIATEHNDQALLAVSYNARAWLAMERLNVAAASDDYKSAEDACSKLVQKGQFVFKLMLYHVRHGRALAERLKGNHEASYQEFNEVVKELGEMMRRDMDFTPKQRRDLRDRLINSMERRADVWLFARPRRDDVVPTMSDDVQAGPEGIEQIQQNYQDAIELVGNDDLAIKTRLLYKKVIARFLGELERSGSAQQPVESSVVPSRSAPVPAPAPAGEPAVRARRRSGTRSSSPRRRLEPINLEFDEAQRTYETMAAGLREDLKHYREITEGCMALSEALADQGDSRGAAAFAAGPPALTFSQAVGKLRAVTEKYAPDCEQLNREKIEMLLLAHELLLDPGIESDPNKLNADSTRMMAVLGATTKVASHPELRGYFDRFKLIASSRPMLDPNKVEVSRRERAQTPLLYQTLPGTPNVDSAHPNDEVRSYSFRLSPRWILRMIEVRDESRPTDQARKVIVNQKGPEKDGHESVTQGGQSRGPAGKSALGTPSLSR